VGAGVPPAQPSAAGRSPRPSTPIPRRARSLGSTIAHCPASFPYWRPSWPRKCSAGPRPHVNVGTIGSHRPREDDAHRRPQRAVGPPLSGLDQADDLQRDLARRPTRRDETKTVTIATLARRVRVGRRRHYGARRLPRSRRLCEEHGHRARPRWTERSSLCRPSTGRLPQTREPHPPGPPGRRAADGRVPQQGRPRPGPWNCWS